MSVNNAQALLTLASQVKPLRGCLVRGEDFLSSPPGGGDFSTGASTAAAEAAFGSPSDLVTGTVINKHGGEGALWTSTSKSTEVSRWMKVYWLV